MKILESWIVVCRHLHGEPELAEEVGGAVLDHGDGLVTWADPELLLEEAEDVVHAGAALALHHAGLHRVQELLTEVVNI